MQELAALAPEFPNSGIGFFPVIANIIGGPDYVLPGIIGNFCDVLVSQRDRIHQLPIDVQLELPVSIITDPHGATAFISLKVIEFRLLQIPFAVDSVHELQLAPGFSGFSAQLLDPRHESDGLLLQAQPDQSIDSERRIANPAIAIIPIAPPPD